MLLNLLYAALVTRFTEQTVDLDVDPFVPDGWRLVEHKKGGKFEWNSSNLKLYVSPNQQGKSGIGGNQLREELKGKSPYNANLLDYLLENPDLVPEQWKGKFVYFWGTVYQDTGDKTCVRCLCRHRGEWRWHYGWLESDFIGSEPAVVPALLPALSAGRILRKEGSGSHARTQQSFGRTELGAQ
jgi:hypothetical protein